MLFRSFFSFTVRKQLYDAGPVCALCKNQIHSFDDSTVDHIHPYSKGGKTILTNAQLAHRSCNARKNNSLQEENVVVDGFKEV